MRRLSLVALPLLGLVCALPTASWADQKSDDIQTLLQLTHRDLDETTMRNARDAALLLQGFEDRHPELTSDQIKQLNRLTQNFSQHYTASIESEISAYYYDHLSDANVQATIAFFKSPDGQAYMKATGGLRRDLIASLRHRLPDMVQGLRDQYLGILNNHQTAPSIGAPQIKT